MIPIFSQPFCVAISVCRGKMPAGRPKRECKAAEGVSKGVIRHRHLERGCVPVWVVKTLGNMKL